jgi:hypothetical protein
MEEGAQSSGSPKGGLSDGAALVWRHSSEGLHRSYSGGLDKALRDLLYEECKWCYKEHMVLWMTHELMKLKASSG